MLGENHDDKQAGHLGMKKTYARIVEQYFRPGMYLETLKHVKEFDTCKKIKPKVQNQIGQMEKRMIEELRKVIAADTMGPLPKSK